MRYRRRLRFLGLVASLGWSVTVGGSPRHGPRPALVADTPRHHVPFFNAMVPEEVVNHIPAAAAWS